MAYNFSPKVITEGLILYLDAANTKSYPGNGNAWTDLSRGGNNGTLTNGPTFNSGNGGNIVFDGINDYVLTSTINHNIGTGNFTYTVWVYPTGLKAVGATLASFIGNGDYSPTFGFDLNNYPLNQDTTIYNINYCLIDEIVNGTKIRDISVNEDVSELFIQNKSLIFLYDINNKPYEIPIVGYVSRSDEKKLKFLSVFGESSKTKSILIGSYTNDVVDYYNTVEIVHFVVVVVVAFVLVD
jgi:hypothetical protein